MGQKLHVCFLITCACFVWGARIFAAETNSVTAPPATMDTQALANSYLQIQEQLHDTQLAIESNRQAAAVEARRNADALNTRIQALEQVVSAQRTEEATAVQKDRQFTLLLAVAFGLTVLAAGLLMAYLQWRAISRLVEFSTLRQPEYASGNGRVAPSLVTSAAAEQASARLFGSVDHLEKRILELEQAARGALPAKNPPPNPPVEPLPAPAAPAPVAAAAPASTPAPEPESGAETISKDREECVANLLLEGQLLLDDHQPEKALECFEIALGLEPKHAEALVKKGSALEKMGRTDDAIACYDQAIEADGTKTIAYLQKGGLFNRLARYDEALHCYEQALRTQEKRDAS
jgi:tetratricopeptide (TPR) repeat protein